MRAGLIRLYPRDWRDRYGDEFEAMLEEQPTNVASVADVVLGAVDAHLTARSPENRGWWLRKLPGFLLTLGALVWAAASGVNVARSWDQQDGLAGLIEMVGLVLVGVGCLAESSFRRGGRRLRWLSGLVPAASLLILPVTMWSLVSLPEWFGLVWQIGSVLIVGGFVGQLVWAAAMATRSSEHRLVMIALACAVLLNLTVGHVVWQSMTAAGTGAPAYPPDLDRFLQWLLPVAWTLIGLSVLWPRHSYAVASVEGSRRPGR